MDKLSEIIKRCQCGISLTVNEHKNYYETTTQALEKLELLDLDSDVSDEVKTKIIETDTLIDLHLYPKNPVSFYKIIHYDLESALDEALEALDQEL